MLIKSADDLSPRLRLLESVQENANISTKQREQLEREIYQLKAGRIGEDTAAHYINTHFQDGEHHAVIHDLRLLVDDQVAQIDHLVMSRSGLFYMLETKNFGGSLRINEHGEFSVRYGSGREYGIPSPLEQSRRHEVVLRKVLERLGIVPRLGEAFDFHHVVLVHPRATITRPSAKTNKAESFFNASSVIKADQFHAWRERFVEKKLTGLNLVKAFLNLRGSGSLRDDANKLAKQHRPADMLAVPDWFVNAMQQDASTTITFQTNAPPAIESNKKKQLICVTCGAKISYAEGKFCWNNSQRFGGMQYCRTHQIETTRSEAND